MKERNRKQEGGETGGLSWSGRPPVRGGGGRLCGTSGCKRAASVAGVPSRRCLTTIAYASDAFTECAHLANSGSPLLPASIAWSLPWPPAYDAETTS
jgi:hypothetical protein